MDGTGEVLPLENQKKQDPDVRRGNCRQQDMSLNNPSVTACAVPPPFTQGRLKISHARTRVFGLG